MRQKWPQIKLLRVKANVVPSHTRVLYGRIFPNCAKTTSPKKIGVCLDSRHLGKVQIHQRKGKEMT